MGQRARITQLGLGLVEILIAGTILIGVLLGMNAALVGTSLMSRKSKDVTFATNLAQQMIEDEKRRCVDKSAPLYYAGLPANQKDSLYTLFGSNDLVLQRYQRTRTVTTPDNNPAPTPTTTVLLAKGATLVTLSQSPSSCGIKDGGRVTMYSPGNSTQENVYVLNHNDGANTFTVDDTAPTRGRQGLQNAYAVGTQVLISSKLVTIQVGYSAASGSDTAATNRTPLITLSEYVSNPWQ